MAGITSAAQRQTSIEEIVTPQATDRFFSLLVRLRSGRETRGGRTVPWIHDISAELGDDDDQQSLGKRLRDVEEGDFVRISNAHLFLPPYAAAAPRARYAAPYAADAGRLRQPGVVSGSSAGRERDLTRYLKALARTRCSRSSSGRPRRRGIRPIRSGSSSRRATAGCSTTRGCWPGRSRSAAR